MCAHMRRDAQIYADRYAQLQCRRLFSRAFSQCRRVRFWGLAREFLGFGAEVPGEAGDANKYARVPPNRFWHVENSFTQTT